MPSPQENTKIEQVIEAFESFAVSIAHSIVVAERTLPTHYPNAQYCLNNREGAREELANALRDFLKPSLRIVSNVDQVETRRAELRAAK